MSLYVRNLNGFPVTLVAPIAPTVVIPANDTRNVTSELAGLSPADYTALEAQRIASLGTLIYYWTSPEEYDTEALIVPDPWLSTVGPGQTLDVGKSGCPYTSIKAACNAIILLGDSGPTKPYLVRVFPGVYPEDPWQMPGYTSVVGQGNRVDVVIETTDPANHFITTAPGSSLKNVTLKGPTGAGKGALYAVHTGVVPFFVEKVAVRRGYYGLLCRPASLGLVHCHEMVNQPDGVAFERFVHVENQGIVTCISCAFMSQGIDGAARVYSAEGPDAELTLDLCSSFTTTPSQGVFSDDGATVRLNACTIETAAGAAGGTAIHAGATGAPTIQAVGCTVLGNWTLDLAVDTGAAVFSFQGRARKDYLALPPGTPVSITDDTPGACGLMVGGELWLGEQHIPMLEYTTAHRDAGTTSGFAVSKGPGLLDLTVGPGVGWVETAGLQIKRIAFSGGSIAIPVDKNWVHVYVDGDTGLLAQSDSEPNARRHLVVADAATDSTRIVLVAVDRIATDNASGDDFTYKTRVLQTIWDSGGTVTQVADPGLNLACTDFVFYAHQRSMSVTGTAGNAITRYTEWYRGPGGAGWVKTVVTGALPAGAQIQTGFWDNAGTQTALGAGQFAGHLLLGLTNDEGTEWHVVRGQEIQAAPNLVVNNPVLPDVLNFEACRLARIVVEGGAVDIAAIYDARRTLLGGVGSSTPVVTGDHGALLGLGDDDHLQYQLRSEKGFAGGYAGLDGAAKVAPTNLALSGVAGQTVAAGAAAVGVSTDLARADHNHSVSVGDPDPIVPGQVSDPGVSTALARADHDHGLPDFGSTADTFCEGDDPRLSDARTPLAHSASHITGADLLPAAVAGGNSGLMTGADKTKLDGIATGAAAVGSDPPEPVGTTSPGVSALASREDHVHAHGNQAGGALHDLVVAGGLAGFMAGSDKTKLDGLPASAVPTSRQILAGDGLAGSGDLTEDRTLTVVPHPDGSIAVSVSGVRVGVLASDAQHGERGGGVQHSLVTGAQHGFMSSSDKTKLDGVATGATNTPLAATMPVNVQRATPALGVATTAARADHQHDVSTAAPGPVGVAAAPIEGTASTLARSDHAHQANTVPSAVGTTNGLGVSGEPARADHVHAHGAQTDGSLHATAIAAGANGFMSGSDKSKLDGIAAGAAALASTPPVNITRSAASTGTGTTAARDDHKHDVSTAAPAATGVGTTSGEGTATSLARSDHSHQANTAPQAVGAANSIGTSGEPARADHVHDAKYQTVQNSGGTAQPQRHVMQAGAGLTVVDDPGNDRTVLSLTGGPSGVFGGNVQVQASEGTSTNATATPQTKVSLTTPAVSGTFVIQAYCGVTTSGNNRDAAVRLYNVTDATEVAADAPRITTAGSYHAFSTFYPITLTGTAKTFNLEFYAPNADTTVTCRRARLLFYRLY